MAFYVGQKVVCVDASPALDGYRPPIKEGAVYTIAGMSEKPHCELGLYLVGIEIPPRPGFYRSLSCYRFRPIVERKTDISELVRIAQEAARTGKVLA